MKTPLYVVFAMSLILAACAPAMPALPPTSVPSATSVPAATPKPTRTPNLFPNPVLKITGEEEVVYDWTSDRCENMNFADLPVRAFRNAEGLVQAILSSDTSYRMIGPELNNLRMDCEPVMRSDYMADPSLFNDNEWVASPYTEDGRTVYALVHNEYWGQTHPEYCPQRQYFPCWDNSITLAISTDGGKSYQQAATEPGHLVARLPYPFEAGAGPEGTRNPSNIIKGPDAYYYSFFNVSEFHTQDQKVCLMRTKALGDPGSWRFWNGKGFEGQFVNPYTDPPATPGDHVCAPLDWDNIGASLNDSISFNTYLNRYVLVGISADTIGGREIWGFFYSFSDDLIQWTRRKLLTEMVLPWTAAHNDDVMYLYPSLLDPESDSRNFETSGKTAYLYYTRLKSWARQPGSRSSPGRGGVLSKTMKTPGPGASCLRRGTIAGTCPAGRCVAGNVYSAPCTREIKAAKRITLLGLTASERPPAAHACGRRTRTVVAFPLAGAPDAHASGTCDGGWKRPRGANRVQRQKHLVEIVEARDGYTRGLRHRLPACSRPGHYVRSFAELWIS